MKNSKKSILITLIPAVLTLYFITQVLFPAISNYSDLRGKYNDTKAEYQDTNTKIEQLKNNKKILNNIDELNNQVADFDVQVPPDFEDEFFLVDLEKFSINTATKILSLNSKREKVFEIRSPDSDKDKTSKKKKKKSKKKQDKKTDLPLTIYEKPFEIKTLGHYNQIINFVNCLEIYQRKFIIDGVSAEISQSDESNPNPKIELTIEGSTFKAVENTVDSESEKTE